MSRLGMQRSVHDGGSNAHCAGSLPLADITDVDTLKKQIEKHSHDLMRVETDACSMQQRLSMIQDRCESLEAYTHASLGRFETIQQRRNASCDGVKQTLEAITGRVVEVATGLEILVGCVVGLEERLQKAKHISGTDVESAKLTQQQQQKKLQQPAQLKQQEKQRRQLREWQRQLQAREQASPEASSPAHLSEAPLSTVSRTPSGQSLVAKRRLTSRTPRKTFTPDNKPGTFLDEDSSCSTTISSARSVVFSKDLLACITSIANVDVSEDLPACIASVVDARVQRWEERILAKLGHAPSKNGTKQTPTYDSTKHLDDSQVDVGDLPCVSIQNTERGRALTRKEDASQVRPTSRSSSSSSAISACTLPPPQPVQRHIGTTAEVHNAASLPRPTECQQQTAKRSPSSARARSQSECALLSSQNFTPQDGKNSSHPVKLHAAVLIREPLACDYTHMERCRSPELQRPGVAPLQESPPTAVRGIPSTPSARTRRVVRRPWASSEPLNTALLRHPSASHLVPLSPPWQTPELLKTTAPQQQHHVLLVSSVSDRHLLREVTH